jgi:DNA-binding response OmpR family regulator
MHLLLVEDDRPLGLIMAAALRRESFSVDWVQDGLRAQFKASRHAYDGIVLDLGLPSCDGMEVCRQLREVRIQTPILVVSGRTSVSERVTGLDAGADDYLVKPFEIPELLARVRAMVRRGPSRRVAASLSYGPLDLDVEAQVAKVGDRRVDLTALECRLLQFLIEHAESVVTREQLIQHVWGSRLQRRSNSPEVYISYLRQKLAAASADLIRTVRGEGYMLRTEAAMAATETASST